MIDTKDKIIDYFKSGIKNTKDFRIGIEHEKFLFNNQNNKSCLLYTSPSPRDRTRSRMPSSA